MRTLKLNNISFDSAFADKFLEAGHRVTSKKQPHGIAITFNKGTLGEKRVGKEVDYLLDLLYQAFIIVNPIESLTLNIDKRNGDDVVINIS